MPTLTIQETNTTLTISDGSGLTIRGYAVSATAPASGDALVYNGSAYSPVAVATTAAVTTALTTLNASNLTSGTVPNGRFPATLPAVSGANLTALNADNVASGNLAHARLPDVSGSWDVGEGNTLTLPREVILGERITASNAFTGSPASTTTIDLFLVAGQSNAEGRGDSSLSPSVISGTAFEYEIPGNTLSALADPVGGATTGSAWPAFARRYYAATGRISGYLEYAVGGSAQAAAATSGGSGNWDSSGAHYTAATGFLSTAITTLPSLGYTPTFRGVLWSQGERDATSIDAATITKADYKAALVAMIARFRSTYGATMPFYIFQTGTLSSGDTAGYVAVREAQEEVAADDAYTWVVFDGAVDFPANDMMAVDGIHYTQDGYNLMGVVGAKNVAIAQGESVTEPRTLVRVDADTRAFNWSEDDEAFQFTAPVEVTGTLTVSGAVNGQTIGEATSLTGTLSVAGTATVLGHVGLGPAAFTPEARLHIQGSSAGTIAAVTNTQMILERNNDLWLHLQTPNNKAAGLIWGDPELADAARVQFDHASDTLALRIGSTNVFAMTNTGTTVTGTTTISGGSPGTISDLSGQRLILQAAGNVWLHMRSPNTATVGMVFADPESNDAGRVQFTHSTNTLALRVGSTNTLEVTNTAATVTGTMTVSGGSPGSISSLSGERLILQTSGNSMYIHLRTPNTATGVGMIWADPESNDAARLAFNHSTNTMTLRVTSTDAMTLTNTAVTTAVLLATAASSTSRAGLRLPHGAAPSSPVDGDMWTTTAGLYVRINGVTVGPLS